MAKNTGRGHRIGAVKGRSEFQAKATWFKRDTKTGRILTGSPHQHKGVRNEKVDPGARQRRPAPICASTSTT